MIRLSVAILLAGLVLACAGISSDKELETAIKVAAEKSITDMRYAFAEGPEDEAAIEMIRAKGPIASLPTLSLALNSKDPKVRVIANRYIYHEIMLEIDEFADNLEATPVKVIEKLIEGIETSQEFVTFYSVATTTMLATLYGLEERLIAAVKAHPEEELYSEMIEHIMTYGRLKNFELVKEWAKTKPGEALMATRSLKNWNLEERITIGDWALDYLSLENPYDRVHAFYALYQARGMYCDRALESLEASLEAGEFARVYLEWLKLWRGEEEDQQRERRLALIEAAEKLEF